MSDSEESELVRSIDARFERATEASEKWFDKAACYIGVLLLLGLWTFAKLNKWTIDYADAIIFAAAASLIVIPRIASFQLSREFLKVETKE